MAKLNATIRTESGTHKTRHLRAAGKVPAILYGHGETPQALTLDKHDVAQAISHSERLIEVMLEGKVQNALVKEVQYDTYGMDILHLDLARVDLDEMVEVTVPIVLRGIPAGATEGGVLQQVLADVTIECMVRSIPDDLRAQVEHMKIGDRLHVKDLTLPAGATCKQDPESLVATVSTVAEEVVVAAEEAPAGPEVIGEKKVEEGEAAEEPAKKEKKE